ncbi:hypothetical protein [Citrifermentans bremense]|uniref:Uncharacterized protein n=2 Tax=Citrifermentans bremense TaxID=60035 RepID=A0A6S6LXK8_9BACT|nr:hypothetical protein [Citrifermentans bremense]
MSGERPRLALLPLAVVAGFSMLMAFSNYGAPFPFLGVIYEGGAAKALAFADSLISLYLLIGVLKRQQLTVWLLMAYNLFDICNAWINLAIIPFDEYARLAVVAVSEDDLRFNTLFVTVILVLLNLYLFRIRRQFDNRSLYLF